VARKTQTKDLLSSGKPHGWREQFDTPILAPPPAPAAELAPDLPTLIPESDPTRSSNVILPVRIWDWIDAKHAEARSKGGKAIRKAAIIRAVFEAVMATEVDLSGVQSEAEITQRINRAIVQ
jgi:hypothetical protein